MSDDVYNVWTDGSYRHANRKVGAGWLVRHNGRESKGEKSIQQLHGNDIPHGSDIAEVFAVASALRAIPAGSSVHLRLDCQNVCDWLTKRRISGDKERVPSLTKLFGEVMDSVVCFRSFTVTRVGGAMNLDLDRVHKLSRTASNPHR